MAIRHSSPKGMVQDRTAGACCAGEGGLRLRPHTVRFSGGFTILEMILVLFLLAGVLMMVVPRFVIGVDLGAAGRQFIGAIRSLQGTAATAQRPVKLYLDLDRGTYWAMVVDGKEEKVPVDAAWAAPLALPDSIRFAEAAVGQTKRGSGRAEVLLYPNGRIDALLVHLMDGGGNILAIAVEPVTGAIRTSDERIEPTRAQAIPDRIKLLLQAVTVQGGSGARF